MSADEINVMLSGRLEDRVDPDTPSSPKLKALHKEIKTSLEEECLLGGKLFRVFTSHLSSAKSVAGDVWERSREEVRKADIVLLLYNGRSGWLGKKSSVGVCHLEAMTAVERARERVQVIRLPMQPQQKGAAKTADEEFQAYLDDQIPWYNNEPASTDKAAVDACRAAVRAAVVELAVNAAQARRPGSTSEQMLEWNRLDFRGRADRMTEKMVEILTEQTGKEVKVTGAFGTFVQWPTTRSAPILFQLHAIPAAMSVAPAREMVGQPFLNDHRLASQLASNVGPVHLIACQRGVTEAQAVRQLGFPDAFIVRAPFGVYVADEVQKIQMILVAGCDEPSTTRRQTASMLEWLERSGEKERLAERAAGRAKIISTISGLLGKP
jgi:hypothetical protein